MRALIQRTIAGDRRGLTVGVVCGAAAIVGVGIADGASAAMVVAVTILGLLVQVRMFLSLWRVIEGAIKGHLDRRELRLCLSLGVGAALMHVVTGVPLTVTTAFAAVSATALFGVTQVMRRRR